MFDFVGLLKAGLQFANTLTDGDNKEKRFHVAMRKNARKALNVAEDIFDEVDDFVAGKSTAKEFERKYDRLRKKFNDLD